MFNHFFLKKWAENFLLGLKQITSTVRNLSEKVLGFCFNALDNEVKACSSKKTERQAKLLRDHKKKKEELRKKY